LGIHVVLCSKDQALAQLCRDTLGILFGTEWALIVANHSALPVEYDFCLWDFIPGETELPQNLTPRKLRRHFFFTHRKDLSALSEQAGTPDLNILLKPVTPTTLQAFFGETCRSWKERQADPGAHLSTLRTERDEMLQCLMQANLKLQEYDQERTNFIARSLHDFRAPLTAVSGYCGLLLEQQLGDLATEQRDILERMQRSAKRLSHMANAMFQLSIAHNIERPLNLQKIDIRECISQAVSEITPFIEDKRLALNLEIDPPPDLLVCERCQIEEMLVNLLDNACKFTPSTGTIEVKGYPFFWERRNGHLANISPACERRVVQLSDPNSFRIDIRDSGPGIPASHLEKIFEEYTSYSGGQDRSGGGLGLAICKMIVRQHHGRVWAQSSPSGAVFSFVLPYQHTGAATSRGGNGFSRAATTVAM
jgi:signal transduction histidine kinase